MTDPRPDFETETFTPFHLFERSNFKFGFYMKSWSQPYYGGSVVRVVGWLHTKFLSGQMIVNYENKPAIRFDRKLMEDVRVEKFVCQRVSNDCGDLMVIENIYGKGWLNHDSE